MAATVTEGILLEGFPSRRCISMARDFRVTTGNRSTTRRATLFHSASFSEPSSVKRLVAFAITQKDYHLVKHEKIVAPKSVIDFVVTEKEPRWPRLSVTLPKWKRQIPDSLLLPKEGRDV